jgi:transcriptional regulator with XRE-family HTH domain
MNRHWVAKKISLALTATPWQGERMARSDGARALQRYMRAHECSQRAAARVLGVSGPTVHAWLGGTKRPRPEMRERIAAWSRGLVPVDAWLPAADRAYLAAEKEGAA